MQTDPVPISDLEGIWRKLHPCARSKKQDQSVHAAFRRFADFIAGKRQFVREVELTDVSAFCTSISQKLAPATVQRVKSILKSAFEGALPPWGKNYFALLRLPRRKGTEVIHHRPLSEAELKQLLAEAKKDPLLYSLALALTCTGLRLGDACFLRWGSVDLAMGTIDVVTHKTGKQALVPILPPFRAVLENALAKKQDDEFVFPDAARLYQNKYSTLIRMGKLLFARALFADEATRSNTNATTKDLLRMTRQKREIGQNSASLFGWHSLRTTFVTISLMYRVPIELVRRIVGHTTADMTLTYFQPTARIMAETFSRQMAGVLSGATTALPCEIEEPKFIEPAQSLVQLPQSCPASYHQTETVKTFSIPLSLPEMSEPPIRLTPSTIIYTFPRANTCAARFPKEPFSLPVG